MDTNTLMYIFHTPCGEVVVEDRNGDRLWFSLTENIYALKTDVPDGDSLRQMLVMNFTSEISLRETKYTV